MIPRGICFAVPPMAASGTSAVPLQRGPRSLSVPVSNVGYRPEIARILRRRSARILFLAPETHIFFIRSPSTSAIPALDRRVPDLPPRGNEPVVRGADTLRDSPPWPWPRRACPAGLRRSGDGEPLPCRLPCCAARPRRRLSGALRIFRSGIIPMAPASVRRWGIAGSSEEMVEMPTRRPGREERHPRAYHADRSNQCAGRCVMQPIIAEQRTMQP